jgi:hypothetical protein
MRCRGGSRLPADGVSGTSVSSLPRVEEVKIRCALLKQMSGKNRRHLRLVCRAKRVARLASLLLVVSLIACAGPEPILRSNSQLLFYGKEMGQETVAACEAKAERAGLQHGTSRSKNAAGGTIIGVVGGAAVGASTGLVGGPTGVAIGAAAGAALGGIIGFAAGTYKPLEPDRGYMESVERCLKEKGYEVSGWQ